MWCGEAKKTEKQTKKAQKSRLERTQAPTERIWEIKVKGVSFENEARERKHNNLKRQRFFFEQKKTQNPVSSIVPRPKPLPLAAAPAPPPPPLPASDGSSMYCDRIERTSAAMAARMRAR